MYELEWSFDGKSKRIAKAADFHKAMDKILTPLPKTAGMLKVGKDGKSFDVLLSTRRAKQMTMNEISREGLKKLVDGIK